MKTTTHQRSGSAHSKNPRKRPNIFDSDSSSDASSEVDSGTEGEDTTSEESFDDEEHVNSVSAEDRQKIEIADVIKARTYLKRKGVEAFLNKYLVESPNGKDIIRLIYLLGELTPSETHIDYNNIRNLQKLFQILYDAIRKVLKSRDRIKSISLPTDIVEQIGKSKNIIVITGAGISTPLGIPDFRSNKGLYKFDLKKYGFKRADEMFNYAIFKEDPAKFFRAAHLILPEDNRYTILHAFLKELESKGKLLRNYSQNIDGVEDNAGISPEKIIRCHGSFNTASCQTPKCTFSTDGKKIFKLMKLQEIPICPRCAKKRPKMLAKHDFQTYGVIKPDITFFGEDLPTRYFETVDDDIEKCDLLIIIGTSLQVSPVNEIASKMPHHIPQILINKDPLLHCDFDVSLLGFSDHAAMYLAKKLKWNLNHEDFEKLRHRKYYTLEDERARGVHHVYEREKMAKRQKLQLKETILDDI
ncbi:hypothetical protein WICPIJ_009382 [Wickerhamomyces pijperi]|uniref:Deacetylase sirtuin-type domain-containing protein n=1 Tax=Wickerhamomyces pijperi TaxID=599730 RepID=A0A9P8PMY8_WICPI|nr:hypothetical protein WICPIJ_009382 [Wickerhamomyces pijperi]